MFLLPVNVLAVTRDEYNDALANVSISAATTYSSDFVYSYYWGGSPSNPTNMSSTLDKWLKDAYQGIKTKDGYVYGTTKNNAGIKGTFTSKFPVYCATFVKLMVYHASSGQATFNYGSNDSYERISINELRRGDIIDFDSHIAIFLDNGNDSDPNTFHVAEASSKVQIRTIYRSDLETGWRIKDSALAKLSDSIITASYDFHDRLDDYSPIISSVKEIDGTNKVQIVATDYKHYDLIERSDLLEPESSGIVAYQITTSNVPTAWKKVVKTDVLDVQEEVTANGKYYVYILDIGGNITTKEVNFTKLSIDKEYPTLGNFSYDSNGTSVKVTITGATDNKGIKEYRYYLNNKLIGNSKDNTYLIENLSRNMLYSFYYEVVDNSNNVSKSMTYNIETELDAIDIEVSDEELYLIKDETYKLEPKVIIDSNNYKIKYQSSNENIVKVEDGLLKGINTGEAIITIFVGQTKKDVKVKISPYPIIFDLYDLPTFYIGKEYNIEIPTVPHGEIDIINSKLPDGLYFSDNKIKGIPENNTAGEYEITFHAKTKDAESIKKYSLFVKYDIEIKNKSFKQAVLNNFYSEKIDINYPANISMVDGELPNGLEIVNGQIQGTPTKIGRYKFTLKTEYLNSTFEKEYTITVSKYSIYDYMIILGIILLGVIIFLIIKNNKKTRKV